MFDSPFEYCTLCGECVLLDQTQHQCAREHACACECPLRQYFTGFEFAAAPEEGPLLICHTRP